MRWWGQLLDNLTFLYVNLRKIFAERKRGGPCPPPSPDAMCLKIKNIFLHCFQRFLGVFFYLINIKHFLNQPMPKKNPTQLTTIIFLCENSMKAFFHYHNK